MSNIFKRLECEEANHVCDKNQYNEAGLLEKIRLSIHLLYCKACQNYTRNNNVLTKLTKSGEVQAMGASNKQNLKSVFEQELAKQKNSDK